MKYHYVYKIKRIDSDEFYIGLRSSHQPFEYDHKYWGSGEWCEFIKFKNIPTVKELVSVFKTRKQAEKFEKKFIFSLRDNNNMMNVCYRYCKKSELPKSLLEARKILKEMRNNRAGLDDEIEAVIEEIPVKKVKSINRTKETKKPKNIISEYGYKVKDANGIFIGIYKSFPRACVVSQREGGTMQEIKPIYHINSH